MQLDRFAQQVRAIFMIFGALAAAELCRSAVSSLPLVDM
jgi:hypothetical protein